MERILGIDYGEKYIGVAISDPLGLTAQEGDIIENTTIYEVIQHLKDIITKYSCKKIVIGLPLHMDGKRGKRVEEVENFAEELKKHIKDIEIIFKDERLSTKILATYYGKRFLIKNKKKKDIKSAQLILQGYLNTLHRP